MADNVVANAGTGGSTFASDDIAGIHYPRAKVSWGVDGSAVDASASNPLPVVQTGAPALPTGAATAAKQPALGTAGAASTDVITVQGIASGVAQPVSGTVAATQSGTWNVTNVSGTVSLPTGAATSANQSTANGSLATIAALSRAEDAAAAGGETGVPVLAVRRDAASSGVSADGDFANLSVDSTGALRVTGGGGGTQYAEDTAHTSGDQMTMAGVVRRDANTSLVSADGDIAPLQVDATGSLKVAIISGAGSGGTAMADDAAFTIASTSFTPVGGVYVSAGDAVNDGDGGAFAMTANRALKVTLVDSAGTELASGAQYTEDSAHVSGDYLTPMGVVRKDTPTQVAGSDGDYSMLINDSTGRMHALNIPYAIPSNTWSYAAAAGGLVSTTGVTAKVAASSGIRNYITSAQVINTHSTVSTEVVIRDGASGTVLHRGWAQAAGGGYSCKFEPPLRGTAATLVEIAEVTATTTTGVLVNLQGYTAAE